MGLFGKSKQQRELDQQFLYESRRAELQLARAIAEEGLTGERRAKALAKIAEAERKSNEGKQA